MSSTYKAPRTAEERERRNEYIRQYRHAHPDRVRQWRNGYILRAAQRLLNQHEQTAASGDDQDKKGGGDE